VVAASANNSLCIVGVAYNAKIGGELSEIYVYVCMYCTIIQIYRMKCGLQNIAYALDIYEAVQSPPVGVRMLDGDMTDMVEAQSLSLRQQYIDIYSSSWGPDDDGRTVDGPGPLARLALESGIRKVSVCLCG